MPSVMSRVPLATAASVPMQDSTCDDLSDREVQAEPLDTEMPAMFRNRSMDSPSTIPHGHVHVVRQPLRRDGR